MSENNILALITLSTLKFLTSELIINDRWINLGLYVL